VSARLPAAARREQLLTVALEVFARNGFHGSSMNEVAEAAGVTKPVLYQHFASKRELYLALLEEVGARLRTAIAKATANAAGPHEQVEQGFRAYFRWVADDHDAFLLLFGSGARRDEDFAEAIHHVEDAIADAIAPLIQADVSAEHKQVLAWSLVGLSEVTSRRLLNGDATFEPDRIAAQVANLAWAGLRGVRAV
jgi:AcrR family transcriptional regulator